MLALKETVKNLYYQPEDSENTLKFNYITYGQAKNIISNDDQDLTTSKFLLIEKLVPMHAKIEILTIEEFFDGMDDADEIDLKQLLIKVLRNVKIFIVKVDTITHLYIIGRTKKGSWVGLTTNKQLM